MTYGRNFWMAAAIAATVTAGTACNRNEPDNRTATRETPATENRSDGWITTSIQAKYFADPDVGARSINVTTENGVVTLRGEIESESARQQAVDLARSVEGVKDVKDELSVSTASAGSAAGERAETEQPTGTSGAEGGGIDPGWITTKIHAQYFVNATVKPWNVDVTTDSAGVVSLNGEVGSQEAKAEAVRIARTTEGVTRVDDHLRVRGEAADETPEPSEPAAEPESAFTQPDAWITAKIQSKYFLDGDVKGRRIDVSTSNGVVTLKGTVASEAERRQAVALARATDGVKSVDDNLQVRAEEARTLPTTGTSARVRSLERASKDAWITTKIQAQYFLDPDVKGYQIDVDTGRGVVTLTGRVASDAVKQEAERIARETEGVSNVVNRLTVG